MHCKLEITVVFLLPNTTCIYIKTGDLLEWFIVEFDSPSRGFSFFSPGNKIKRVQLERFARDTDFFSSELTHFHFLMVFFF